MFLNRIEKKRHILKLAHSPYGNLATHVAWHNVRKGFFMLRAFKVSLGGVRFACVDCCNRMVHGFTQRLETMDNIGIIYNVYKIACCSGKAKDSSDVRPSLFVSCKIGEWWGKTELSRDAAFCRPWWRQIRRMCAKSPLEWKKCIP